MGSQSDSNRVGAIVEFKGGRDVMNKSPGERVPYCKDASGERKFHRSASPDGPFQHAVQMLRERPGSGGSNGKAGSLCRYNNMRARQ